MAAAEAHVIATHLGREASLLLVAGPGTAPAAVAPERVVEVPGPGVRLSFAAGAAAVGRTVLVRSDDGSDARALPWARAGRLVALTRSLDVATAAWEAGVPVLAPGWPADLAPLLLEAVEAGSPRCLYLHGHDVPPAPPLALDPLGPDGTRVLMHGKGPTFVAGADRIVSLLEAAWQLARDGRRVTVVQLLRLVADGPSPADVAGAVFAADGSGMRRLAADSTDPRSLEDAIGGMLAGDSEA